MLDHFGKQIVVTTDMLVEGIHFDLMYTPMKHLGYKSVIVNLSDVYAMNAIPQQITVSIAFSNRLNASSPPALAPIPTIGKFCTVAGGSFFAIFFFRAANSWRN